MTLCCELPPGEVVNIILAHGLPDTLPKQKSAKTSRGVFPRSFELRLFLSSELERGPLLLRTAAAPETEMLGPTSIISCYLCVDLPVVANG